MTRFFVRASAVADGTVTITGADAYHIARALRMATGERITVCDMQKNEYQCVLTHIRDDIVTAEILSSRKNDTELCCRVRLYQSLAKGEKMEYIIQKSVELGADAIIPVASARCIVKLTAAQAEQKRMRWQKIADGAAKQSGRGVLPQILPGIFTGFIFAFTLSIDDFVISYFTSQDVSNLSMTIYSMARRGLSPKINALSTIMFVSVMVLLIIVNVRSSRQTRKGASQ